MKRVLWVGIFVLSVSAAQAANESYYQRSEPRQPTSRRVDLRPRSKPSDTEPLFSAVVEKAAIENDLPASLLYGLFWHESRFQESAERKERHLCRKHRWKDSDCRSYGLGQVILGYHRRTCGIQTARELRDFHKSVPCAAKILGGYVRQEKGDIRKGLKRFNGPLGKGYAQKVIAEAKRFGFQS